MALFKQGVFPEIWGPRDFVGGAFWHFLRQISPGAPKLLLDMVTMKEKKMPRGSSAIPATGPGVPKLLSPGNGQSC